jgi:hypothetical protein
MSSFRREREARTGITSLAPPSRTPPGSVAARRRTPLTAAALIARGELAEGGKGYAIDPDKLRAWFVSNGWPRIVLAT